jgi:hypothetical protein
METDDWRFGEEIVEFRQWQPRRANLGVGWRSIAARRLGMSDRSDPEQAAGPALPPTHLENSQG